MGRTSIVCGEAINVYKILVSITCLGEMKQKE